MIIILILLLLILPLLLLILWLLQLLLFNSGSTSFGESDRGGITMSGKVQLIAFCLFEACVGVFWPSIMSMRAGLIPEGLRSTIMNIFRIPLNLFVCLLLSQVESVLSGGGPRYPRGRGRHLD
jgi:hypothetical protein